MKIIISEGILNEREDLDSIDKATEAFDGLMSLVASAWDEAHDDSLDIFVDNLRKKNIDFGYTQDGDNLHFAFNLEDGLMLYVAASHKNSMYRNGIIRLCTDVFYQVDEFVFGFPEILRGMRNIFVHEYTHWLRDKASGRKFSKKVLSYVSPSESKSKYLNQNIELDSEFIAISSEFARLIAAEVETKLKGKPVPPNELKKAIYTLRSPMGFYEDVMAKWEFKRSQYLGGTGEIPKESQNRFKKRLYHLYNDLISKYS